MSSQSFSRVVGKVLECRGEGFHNVRGEIYLCSPHKQLPAVGTVCRHDEEETTSGPR